MFAPAFRAAAPALQRGGRFLVPAVAAATQLAVTVLVAYAEITMVAVAGYGGVAAARRLQDWRQSRRHGYKPASATSPAPAPASAGAPAATASLTPVPPIIEGSGAPALA
jgi:hypothetical protein